MAPPFKEAEFDILYGTGISRDGEIVDLGSEMGVVEKSGAWYSFAGERIGQGREAAKQFLKDHPETAAQIMAKVMDKSGLKSLEPEAAPPVAEKKTHGKVPQKV
jgi:recombination protein RecA